MATVYLAEDVRHERRVAVKVLLPELAALLGAERFLSEIHVTAGLQHPHILPLFDSGQVEGQLFYVMPYVEGESLRARIDRERQLPVESALSITREVASALDYAHRHGVIHRDIKPENILLHDGHALVADFGIALAVTTAGGSRLTQTGLSLGTPQYMSPEQATGEREIDARSDIYSLGAVAYEMLAGEPPFSGPNSQAIVAKVITEKPRPLTSLRETVPLSVSAAIGKALRKLPADRHSSVAEFAHALDELPLHRSDELTRPTRLNPWVIAAGVAITAGMFGMLGFGIGRKSISSGEDSPPSRLALLTPNLGGTGIAVLNRQIAITPDGSAVLFVTQDSEGLSALAYQRLDGETSIVIPGGERVLSPEISPDGRTIVGLFVSIGGTQSANVRLPVRGGTPAEISRDINTPHMAIEEDGDIWYSRVGSSGIVRLTPNGRVEAVPRTAGLRYQQPLETKNKALVIRSALGSATGPGLVRDMVTGAETELTDDPVVEMRYAAGHIIYVRGDGTLWAAPFDVKRLHMKHPPVQIGSGVSLTGSGIAQFGVARNGNVAYIPEEPRWLVFVDRSGSLRNVMSERRNFHAPQFSPDGNRISMDLTSSDGRDVWTYSIDQGTLTRATFDRDGHDATWTPDGRYITYTSFKNGALGIYRTTPGSGSKPDSLLATPLLGYTGEWLKDGSGLVTTANNLEPRSESDIAFVANGGRGPVTPIVVNSFRTHFPTVSPDGKWLAYVSNQSGVDQVYVRPWKREGEQLLVSQTGGTEPVWSPDGRELFYRGTTGNTALLMAASVRPGSAFAVTERRALFSMTDIAGGTPHANYDVSPDGRTFVMVKRSPATRIMVLQNLPAVVRDARGGATDAN